MTLVDTMRELLPCPFCGGNAEPYIAFPRSEYPWHVSVDHGEECPMRITDSHCYRDENELREAWNTRAAMAETR